MLREDIELVISEGLSRTQWPLRNVHNCETGSDGLVRTAEVRVKGNLWKRDVRYLCFLGVTKVAEAEHNIVWETISTQDSSETVIGDKPSRQLCSHQKGWVK